jgi:hypothetical protein
MLGIVGVVGVLTSVLAVWAHQSLFDSSTVSRAVEEALAEPEVTDALAVRLTDEVLGVLDLNDLIATRLPEDLEPFAPVLAGGVRTAVNEAFSRLLATEEAQAVVVAATERAHAAVLRLLEGDGLSGGISVDEGAVSVNLLPLLGRGLERLQERGLLSDVDLPELSRDGDPVEQQAALEDALDRELPDGFGQLFVYESENIAAAGAALDSAQRALSMFRRGVVLVVAVTVLALVGSALMARRRRRGILLLTLGSVAALVIGRVVIRTVVEEAPSLAAQPGGRAAIRAMVTTLADGLLGLVTLTLIVAVVLAVLAIITAEERSERLRAGAGSVGGTVRALVDEHRDLTALAAGAAALLVITVAGFSWWSLLIASILAAVAAWAAVSASPGTTVEAGDDPDGS